MGAVRQQRARHDSCLQFTNGRRFCTKCVSEADRDPPVNSAMLRCERGFDLGDGLGGAGGQGEARFQPGQAAATDRHGVGLQGGQFDDAGFARALQPDDAVDGHDVAAVDPYEPAAVEPRLHHADGQRAEQLRLAVENIGVVGVGVTATTSSTGTKCVPPSRSTGNCWAVRRGGPPAPPSGPKVPCPRSTTLLAAGCSAPALSSAEGMRSADLSAPARARSGTSVSRKMPETMKATTATTIASRSVESTGAPAGPCSNGTTVRPAMAV